jgi:hypothetical protein
VLYFSCGDESISSSANPSHLDIATDCLASPAILMFDRWDWGIMFYIRLDLDGYYHVYPHVGGPFQTLDEVHSAINCDLQHRQDPKLYTFFWLFSIYFSHSIFVHTCNMLCLNSNRILLWCRALKIINTILWNMNQWNEPKKNSNYRTKTNPALIYLDSCSITTSEFKKHW